MRGNRSFFSNLLARVWGDRRKKSPKSPARWQRSPSIEYLEERKLLSVNDWTGAAGNFSFNTAANWSTGSVPSVVTHN